MGLVGYPYFFFVEFLGPMVEAMGLVGVVTGLLLGALDVPFALLFFLGAYGYHLVLTACILLFEEVSFHRYEGMRDRLWLLLWMLLEYFGYRQLTVLWRLCGFCQIPLDLVVKYQAVDIAEVMFYRSGAGPSSTHHVATGNRGVSRSHHCKITGLPLNLGECGPRSAPRSNTVRGLPPSARWSPGRWDTAENTYPPTG